MNADNPLVGSDTLFEEFDRVERYEKISGVFAFASLIAFLLYAFDSIIPATQWSAGKSLIAFSFLAAISTVTGALARYHYSAVADAQRAAQLLADSFGTHPFKGPEAGQDFFSAGSEPGVVRLLESLHQNCYFKARLLTGSFYVALVMAVGALLLAFAATWFRHDKLIEFSLVIWGLSDMVFLRLLRLGLFISRMRSLKIRIISLALKIEHRELDPRLGEVEAVHMLVEYETAKARYAVRTSQSRYEKLNPIIEGDWRKEIRKSGAFGSKEQDESGGKRE